MSSSLIQVLQMKQIPSIVIMLVTKMLELLLSFMTLIKGEESSRVFWSIFLARSRLMMTTPQFQRIYHHQSKERTLTPIIQSLLGGGMMKYCCCQAEGHNAEGKLFNFRSFSGVPTLIQSFERMPKYIDGYEIKEDFKDEEVGTVDAMKGSIDGVKVEVHYVMMLMSSYGTLERVCGDKKRVWVNKDSGAPLEATTKYPELVFNHI